MNPRLSWNEIRVRASSFSARWKDASYEKGETQSFYDEFFKVFGVRRRTVARYEEHVQKLDNKAGYIDLFWPGVLIVEQKSAGRDLNSAYDQAGEYFDALSEQDRPRYILVSDFQHFKLRDLDERRSIEFELQEFHRRVEEFGFILGLERRTFRDQDPANIKASEIMGRLHDALEESGHTGRDLERILVRLVFCLFADDTGIFEPRDIFLDYIESRTSEDGSDLGPLLIQLFQVLDTPIASRSKTLDEDLAQFPYVNGLLFEGSSRIPAFDSNMRKLLLEACHFDWSVISPAIFGALFQSVMDPVKRRAGGAHYTTEPNILKVIEPLFLDDLKKELERLKARKDNRKKHDLRQFQTRLGELRFLDPACGCGNFLIIAYRELRQLELEAILEIRSEDRVRGQIEMYEGSVSVVNVDQFYGIELEEFAVHIAETAMWMMDHIMNNKLSLETGKTYSRIPLETAPHIVRGDALNLHWQEILASEQCSYILGNPPYGGAKFQTDEQRAHVRRIAALGESGGTLDFVAAWFIRAGQYVQTGQAQIGFVATNSITQGQQVAQLWPILFERYDLEIAFAHRTFAWGSDVRGKAHVHVVIIGLSRARFVPARKRLFTYPDVNGQPSESTHTVLSPYLTNAAHLEKPRLTVRQASRPINGLNRLKIGSKPIDGGNYIFGPKERDALLLDEPGAAPLLRPFVGAQEFLHGNRRWILALHSAQPKQLRQLPLVRERISAVRKYREASKSKPTQALSKYPKQYHVNVLPNAPFLVIPEVSSERREYVPIGYLEPPVIPSNLVRVLLNATLVEFALLTSAMHMAWLRAVAGRLESRYRYSIGVVYNTFQLPAGHSLESIARSGIHVIAQAVLDARAAHSGDSLAELYDPDCMPADLRRAHSNLDRAVDRLYRPAGFTSEADRLAHLFSLYEKARYAG